MQPVSNYKDLPANISSHERIPRSFARARPVQLDYAKYLVGRSFTVFKAGIKTSHTLETYSFNLYHFCEFLGMNTDEIAAKYNPIIKHKGRSVANLDGANELHSKIEDYIMTLLRKVEGGKIKPTTCRNLIPAVRLFLDMNRIDLNWRRLNKMLPSSDGNAKDEAFSRQDIQKMLQVCDLRTKVVVLFMASGGMRLEGLAGLTDGCITPFYDEQDKSKVLAACVEVYKGTPDSYFTFVTSEAHSAYQSYKGMRQKFGEVIEADSPLISKRFNQFSKRSDAEKYKKPLSADTIAHLMEVIMFRSGVRIPSRDYNSRFNKKRSHGLRKFFSTTISSLVSSDGRRMVDFIHKEWLLGHALKDEKRMEDHYNRSDLQHLLLGDYLRVAKALTFSDEEKLKVKVSELEQKEKDMESRIASEVKKQVAAALAAFKPDIVEEGLKQQYVRE